MEIKGFIQSSLIEWEGKIASVIFLPGCNLRCHYCHAAHLVLHPERLESLSRPHVLRYMRRQKGWLDGAVITGGEPTLHGDELIALIREIRAIPLSIMIETNGMRPERVGRLIRDGLIEAIAMDVKAPLTPEDYERVAATKVSVEDLRHSIRLILDSGIPHEFRITLVPGLVGRDELKRIVPELRGARRIALQNFKPDLCLSEPLRHVTPFTAEELTQLAALAAANGAQVMVRGRDHAALRAVR